MLAALGAAAFFGASTPFAMQLVGEVSNAHTHDFAGATNSLIPIFNGTGPCSTGTHTCATLIIVTRIEPRRPV